MTALRARRQTADENPVAGTPKKLSEKNKRASVEHFVKVMAKTMPDPKCELFYVTPYQLLVSVILSAQTTDKMVNRCMQPLYEQGLSPRDVIQLGEAGLLTKIKSIGLAPTKAKNVTKMTTILLEEHGGEVPNTRDALEALPGVGRKTANVVLGELFGQPTLAVDTHVFRVAYRLGWHNEKTPRGCEDALMKLVPLKYLPKAHHWLILHGRYTCKAQKPLCVSCPLRSDCASIRQ